MQNMYINKTMSNYTSCRITPKTKTILKKVSKCMKMEKEEPNAFYTEDYVIERLSNNYLVERGFQSIQNDIKEKDIEQTERYLRKNRIDTNLPLTTKDDLKGIAEGMIVNNMADRKLTYIDVVEVMKKHYLKSFPNLNSYLLDYRKIKQQMGMDELSDRIEKEKYDRL